jgi:uncharacterized damage-inducible protein DinB
MPENILERFFEHHVWANLQIVQACAALTEEQLEAQPHSATKGTIRETLMHLAEAERGYLGDLTGERDWGEFKGPPTLEELKESLAATGEGLLTLAREGSSQRMNEDVHSQDGYTIAPWLLMLQALNHATEHREQIKSMLTALGLKPPRIDGWIYGRTQNAFVAPEKKG